MNELLVEPPPRLLRPQGAAAWSYREQQVQGASPLQAILLVYDFALGACARKELPRALEALSTLRGALDLSGGGEIAARLQVLYLYCEEQVRQRHFDGCERILRELRSAWAQCASTPVGNSLGSIEITA
jgi:flagellar secretion chaperone FliS